MVLNTRGIADSDYARRRRRLMDIVNRIRQIGGQLEVDLPRIALIGNQSAGKSSLVEAISEITVPRSEQTCTRCPTEVRIKQSETPWTCQVSVRFEFDVNGQPREGVKEQPFGPPITDHNRDQVGVMLRKAQLAILNPSIATVDLQRFIDMQLDDIDDANAAIDRPELSFSQNVVVVEVSGPRCTDLTFVDLPGIIADDGDEPGSIELIQGLVRRHIEEENCLILVTITMRDDKKNQAAIKMAREADPGRKRTIPVLTKPDTLEEGQDRHWLRSVRNEEDPMPHGYFVTKQPNLKDREEGITRERAREKERQFFDGPPWVTLPRAVRDHLGTENLTSALSSLLSNHIQAKLPSIISKIDTDHRDVLKELGELPEAPSSDPVRDIAKLSESLKDAIAAYTGGSPGHESLIQDINAASKRFKETISSTRLQFSVSDEPAATKDDATPPTLADLRSRVKLSLDDVTNFIELSRSRELPFDIPPAAKRGLIEMSTTKWKAITENYFDEVKPIISDRFVTLVNTHFGRFDQGLLRSLVLTAVTTVIDDLADKTLRQLHALLDLDLFPFTQNDHYLSSGTDKYLSELKAKRQRSLGDPNQQYWDGAHQSTKDQFVNEILGKLTTLGLQGCTADDLTKLTGPDLHERELKLIAEVKAYFQVSFKRIIDNVPGIVDRDFVRPAAHVVHEALLESLSIHGPDGIERCKEYLAESPDVVVRRKDLISRKKRLEQIKFALRSFGTGSHSNFDQDIGDEAVTDEGEH